MATTLANLRTEVSDRGYSHVSDSRLNTWINGAYSELASYYPWPFLEATTSGVPPLTIADLSRVLSVNNSDGTRISYVDRRILASLDTVFTTTGTPQYWFFEGSDIKVYPVTTGTVTVRYIKFVSKLSTDSDAMALPDRFFDVLVDGAVVRALKDEDLYQEAQVLRQEWDRQINLLLVEFAKRQYEPGFIVVTNTENA